MHCLYRNSLSQFSRFNTVNGNRLHALQGTNATRAGAACFNTVNGNRLHALLWLGSLATTGLKMGGWKTSQELLSFGDFSTKARSKVYEPTGFKALPHVAFHGFRFFWKTAAVKSGMEAFAAGFPIVCIVTQKMKDVKGFCRPPSYVCAGSVPRKTVSANCRTSFRIIARGVSPP